MNTKHFLDLNNYSKINLFQITKKKYREAYTCTQASTYAELIENFEK